MQLVEDACIRYLMNLKLPAEQLIQLMQLWDRLMLMEARKQMLQKYAHRAWIGEVLEILPLLFEELVHAGPAEIKLCQEVLFSSECGALCELLNGNFINYVYTGSDLLSSLRAWYHVCRYAHPSICCRAKELGFTAPCRGYAHFCAVYTSRYVHSCYFIACLQGV